MEGGRPRPPTGYDGARGRAPSTAAPSGLLRKSPPAGLDWSVSFWTAPVLWRFACGTRPAQSGRGLPPSKALRAVFGAPVAGVVPRPPKTVSRGCAESLNLRWRAAGLGRRRQAGGLFCRGFPRGSPGTASPTGRQVQSHATTGGLRRKWRAAGPGRRRGMTALGAEGPPPLRPAVYAGNRRRRMDRGRQLLDCASPLALWMGHGKAQSGRGLPHSKALRAVFGAPVAGVVPRPPKTVGTEPDPPK